MPLVYSKDIEGSNSPNDGQSFVSDSQSNSAQKYNVTYYQYPYNLDGSPEYGTDSSGTASANKVVFFINVPGASKVIKNATDLSYGTVGTGSSTGYIDVPKNQYLTQSGERLKGVARDLAGKVNLSTAILDTKKRLLTAIVLYTPTTIRTRYSVRWDEEDLTSAGLGEELLSTAANYSGFKGADGQNFKDTIGSGMKAGGAYIGRSILSSLPFAQKALGISPSNSKQEQLFRGVDFRTFEFDYKFAPRNMAEADNVLKIIRMFRHHMLPEFLDKSEFLYIYPSEFDVRYYKGSEENPHLEKQMTSVLTAMNVDYAPLGVFNTFPNGMPTHINMTLSFKELGIPTKETSPSNSSGI